MPSGTARRVCPQDIQLVQNLIERCLQLYMNRKEVVDTLLVQAKIEPGFTELVQNSAFYAQELPDPAVNPETFQHPANHGLTNSFTNGRSSLHSTMLSSTDISVHANRIGSPPNMTSSQRSNMVLMQGVNGGLVKIETGYSGASPYMFDAESNVLEARSTIGDASVASFKNAESSSQPLNEPLLDGDTSSFGFLGRIPRNFSLSDLTADFSQSSDILESYYRSPFLATDADHFLNACEGGEQGESRRLDPISERLTYENFGDE
ncbi:hypothetical protein SAY86_029034 [Trapa natans]|uniref:Uncharacterized protein n=1 Tax=Trapa natans TaxID=22666 RepID=A0AAN7LVU5_TRANT|nr:hypothetical protein SAY86_029034 [Trapa natans]